MANKKMHQNIMGALRNPVFGGSVFNPIKAAPLSERGQKLSKKNNLKEQILSVPIDYTSGGSFYAIRNVKTLTNTF